MGYKQKHKQAPPRPLPGSAEAGKRRRDKGKKKASSAATDERKSFKSIKSGKAIERKVLPVHRRGKKHEIEPEEDSDDEEALKQG